MKTKKLCAVLLSAAMVTALAGCGSKEAAPTTAAAGGGGSRCVGGSLCGEEKGMLCGPCQRRHLCGLAHV